MPNLKRNFIRGRMNKSLDERLVPQGEYVDAMNVRLGSTENSEIGSVENSKGNTPLTVIEVNGQKLSTSAKCIGAFEDGARETIYWFVTDHAFPVAGATTQKCDLIMSYDTNTTVTTYHIISINDGTGNATKLNFNSQYLITGVDMVDDMLFFTDDYNPPRKINIKKNYPDPTPAGAAGIDDFDVKDILVIKAPPTEAPTWTKSPSPILNQENFIENRFVCFAYRYKYEDGEYSATSQFSDPAFISSPFAINTTAFLNSGMINLIKSVDVSYNTGGPLVKGIDLLFKEANDSTIKVIQKLDKVKEAIPDNVTQTFTFDNSKIYTILPTSEILRLYDNVPRFAKAQSIMGNRLMYGNYVDGYNLKDANDNDIQLDYSCEKFSTFITNETLTPTYTDVDYNLYSAITVTNAGFSVDLSNVSLDAGSIFSFGVTFIHSFFEGASVPTATTPPSEIQFIFTLNQTYSNVYEMVNSSEFLNNIGTVTNIQPMANACNGTTFTDSFNCILPATLNAFTKDDSGIGSALGQPINVVSNIGSSVVEFELLAAKYVSGTTNAYEYYKIQVAEAFFQNIADTKSLHSDRDYEVGIIYMDDFNRATTTLVSTNNDVHIPCSDSTNKNQVKVTIPTYMLAPSWATRYKFVMKESLQGYNTVYSNFFVNDPDTSTESWFLIQGENAAKIEIGDRLKVKADSNGALGQCAVTTVLDKEGKQADFAASGAPLSPESPAGTYMKLSTNNFAAAYDSNSVIDCGKQTAGAFSTGLYPELSYNMAALTDSAGNALSIPAGSIITIEIEFERRGSGDGNGSCGRDSYSYNKVFTASQDFADIHAWFVGDNINVEDPSGCDVGTTETCNSNVFDPVLATIPAAPNNSVNQYQFLADPATPTEPNRFYLTSGTPACSQALTFPKRASRISCRIEVVRLSNNFIFETEPQDAVPDIFYEGSMSYGISNGYHRTYNPESPNNVDQTASVNGIVYLDFFNCFTFGNGAESYKIEDSIIGNNFNLGNRVVSVSAQDFKEADRFADITYSGVYNDESNVNKLNEFNLGLLNFLPLEDSFGPIQILHARETDLLTLQEDKISYVTVGKNILTDAVGGGTVTSIPEVLGQQVARLDEYGISNNPESFVVYGYDKFFTDSKRGAVIRLKGSAGASEQLTVISEVGMRSWFRDLFITNGDTQKLGGFDPYMNEYVLSSNDIKLPSVTPCIECGVTQSITAILGTPYSYCVDFGSTVGAVSIPYVFAVGDSGTIDVTYNGVTTSTGVVSGSGTLSFNKNSSSVTTATITVTASVADAVVRLTANCPGANPMKVVTVCVTSSPDATKTIHNQYRYTDGSYISPLHSNSVTFVSGTTNPLISQYTLVSGVQGDGICPTTGSTVSLISNKIGTDDFVFDTTADEFRYLRTNTLYANTPGDIATLLAASTQALPLISSLAPNTYSADFTLAGTTEEYLYLIFDYRNSLAYDLCYDAVSKVDVCCNCTQHWYLVRNVNDSTEEYFAQSPSALVIGTYYNLIGLTGKCFEVISTTTTQPTQHINATCTP
jgi:hypothetical protein